MAQPSILNEIDRLKELQSSIMDSLAEAEYDSITQLASAICGTSISLISLLDEERQWFKSTVGLNATETPKDFFLSICYPGMQFMKLKCSRKSSL
jgi:hypothetical protein